MRRAEWGGVNASTSYGPVPGIFWVPPDPGALRDDQRERDRELVQELRVRGGQVKRDGVVAVARHDPPREVARARVLRAGRRTDDAGVVAGIEHRRPISPGLFALRRLRDA